MCDRTIISRISRWRWTLPQRRMRMMMMSLSLQPIIMKHHFNFTNENWKSGYQNQQTDGQSHTPRTHTHTFHMNIYKADCMYLLSRESHKTCQEHVLQMSKKETNCCTKNITIIINIMVLKNKLLSINTLLLIFFSFDLGWNMFLTCFLTFTLYIVICRICSNRRQT